MPDLIYPRQVSPRDKPLVWLHGEVRSPPFSREARIEAGYLLRRLQQGDGMGLPHSRPMPSIGPRCHELRVRDRGHNWRIFYRVDDDAILLLGVLDKQTQRTPKATVDACKARNRGYDEIARR